MCLVSKKPDDCTEKELGDFTNLVLEGGQVISQDLYQRVRSAAFLIMLTDNESLAGVGAIKQPHLERRESIFQQAKCSHLADLFSYELGWVYILPSARQRGFSKQIVCKALSSIPNKNVFATVRSDNEYMCRTLEYFNFKSVSQNYLSYRGKYRLRLFVCDFV